MNTTFKHISQTWKIKWNWCLSQCIGSHKVKPRWEHLNKSITINYNETFFQYVLFKSTGPMDSQVTLPVPWRINSNNSQLLHEIEKECCFTHWWRQKFFKKSFFQILDRIQFNIESMFIFVLFKSSTCWTFKKINFKTKL